MKLCMTQIIKHWKYTLVSIWTETYDSFSLHKQNGEHFETSIYISYADERTQILQAEGKNGFQVSYGKVQNYCTLHSKARDSNKKHTKKTEQLCYTSDMKNYGFPVKAH